MRNASRFGDKQQQKHTFVNKKFRTVSPCLITIRSYSQRQHHHHHVAEVSVFPNVDKKISQRTLPDKIID